MEDFAVSGKARMSLRPLLNRPPVVGAMKVQHKHQKRRPHSPKHYVCPFVISCQRALTWALRVLHARCTAAAVEPTNQLKKGGTFSEKIGPERPAPLLPADLADTAAEVPLPPDAVRRRPDASAWSGGVARQRHHRQRHPVSKQKPLWDSLSLWLDSVIQLSLDVSRYTLDIYVMTNLMFHNLVEVSHPLLCAAGGGVAPRQQHTMHQRSGEAPLCVHSRSRPRPYNAAGRTCCRRG